MANRRQKTTIDYIIIALNPALIVAMIASLVYFLTLCFYRGEFLARMNYILMLFVVACVGIARIAIEEGRARAIGFAAALGGATLFSVSRFVGGGLPMVVLLLALIWYLADRITIDCTVIDDDKDASGEGLLQGGLFGDKKVQPAADVSLDGTTGTDDVTAPGPSETPESPNSDTGSKPKPRRPKKATHRPGMWVMYLAFGAIPLYGLGQVMLPASDAIQSTALKSLGIYLASSLLLLVSTSFLGLRRYLRQRGVEMPAAISINWLGFGAAIVAGLLLVCFTLPLPGKLLGEVELPSYVENRDDLEASKYGWGDEGVDSKRKDVPGAEDGEEPTSDQQPSGDKGKGKKQSGGSKGKEGQSGDSQDKDANKQGSGGESKDKSSGGKEKSESKDGKQQSDKNSQNEQSGDKGKPKKESDGKKSDGDKSDGDKSDGDKSDGDKSDGDKSDGDKSKGEEKSDQQGDGDQNEGKQADQDRSENGEQQDGGEQQNENSESEEEGSASDAPPPSNDSNFEMPSLPDLSGLFRYLILIVLGGIVAFYVFRHWDDIAQWFRELLGMWGQEDQVQTADEASPSEAAVRRRSFASYRNPLDDPSISLEDAIVQTFGALCAWSREGGYERSEDTAPAEFGRELGKHFPEQRLTLATVCDLYSLVVYGNRRAAAEHRNTLEALWRFMLSPRTQPPVSEDSHGAASVAVAISKPRWKE